MSSRAIIVVAGAIGGLVVLDQMGRKAGPANQAAAAELRTATVAGVSFSVPANARMEDAHRAMWAAIGSRELDNAELRDVCRLWLDAYAAGCASTSGNVIGEDLYNESKVNYSMLDAPGDQSGVLPGSCSTAACADDVSAFLTPIGRAVCAVKERSTWPGDPEEVFVATLELARQMDAADYRRDGDRKHDALPGLSDLPGKILNSFVGDVITSPLFAVGVIGLIAWKVWR